MEKIVNLHSIYFVLALAIFLAALASFFFVYSRRARQTSQGTWPELIGRLKLIDRDGVARIALDVIDESGHPKIEEGDFPLDPAEIWPLIGGLEGVEALRENCDVLIDLAFYVQKWYPEGLLVAEQLRLNAREVEWHLSRLKGAAETGNLESAFPNYAQRAITTYYLMTKSVLALYEHVNLPELPDLQRAI